MPARGRASGASQEPPSASREASMDVDEQQDVEMGPPARREAGERGRPVSQRGEQDPEPPRDLEPSTRVRWLDVRPVVPVNVDCPRERAVEGLI